MNVSSEVTSHHFPRFLLCLRLRRLDQELLNLVLDSQPCIVCRVQSAKSHLDSLNLGVQLSGLVGCDGSGDDGSGDTASSSEGSLAGDEDVRDVLVLAQEGQVKDNLDRLDVGGHDDELADTSVKGLGGLVSTAGQRFVRVFMGKTSTHPFLSCL